MTNKFYKFITFGFLLTIVGACGDFGDLNKNPNQPVSVSTATMLSGAERAVSSVVGSTLGARWAQHISDITYTEYTRYQDYQQDFSSWYTTPLQNLKTYIDVNSDPETAADAAVSGSNANQIAVAKILQSYYYHYLTDLWGPIPYSEALKGLEGILLPKYDSQEDIYKGIISNIEEALDLFDGGAPPKGDYIFGGDIDRWKQFGNTIKMQAALRMSDISPDFASNKFNEAISDGVITSDLFYPYLAETNNQNPWYASFITRTDFAISEHLANFLEATGDPRLYRFADPTVNSVLSGNPQWVGMPYGLENSSYQPTNVSYPNSQTVKGQDSKLPIYTVAQVEFALAEAVVRGWRGGDAETHYKNAIRASLSQWGAEFDTEQDFDDFYNQPDVRWNGADWKTNFARQKWIGLYIQGWEAYAEWRRLDAPQFVQPETPLNPSGLTPKRIMYSNLEANLNSANYQAAINAWLGGKNADDTPLWWDVH